MPCSLHSPAREGRPQCAVDHAGSEPFQVLYAGVECDKFLRGVVRKAIGEERHILPICSCREPEIRLLWTQRQFDCAFLVLNNIIVPGSSNSADRFKSVLALIPWMRQRSSAAIIVLSGWILPGMEEEALRGGADRFFPLPFPPDEVVNLLRTRLGLSCH